VSAQPAVITEAREVTQDGAVTMYDIAETIAAADGAVIPVEKELAIDVLPELQAVNGWTQEKLEGFTIAADGHVYGVTDNDGLADAKGGTAFLRLGSVEEIFGTGTTPTDTPEPTETAEPTATAEPTETAGRTDVPTASATGDATAPAADSDDTDGNLVTTGADAGALALPVAIALGAIAPGAIAAGTALVIRRRHQAWAPPVRSRPAAPRRFVSVANGQGISRPGCASYSA